MLIRSRSFALLLDSNSLSSHTGWTGGKIALSLILIGEKKVIRSHSGAGWNTDGPFPPRDRQSYLPLLASIALFQRIEREGCCFGNFKKLS